MKSKQVEASRKKFIKETETFASEPDQIVSNVIVLTFNCEKKSSEAFVVSQVDVQVKFGETKCESAGRALMAVHGAKHQRSST